MPNLAYMSNSLRIEAQKAGDILHYRPWRKRVDGYSWFRGKTYGYKGSEPVYRIFKGPLETLQLFDQLCEYLLEHGKLIFLRPLHIDAPDEGGMYDFKDGPDAQATRSP